MTLVCFITIFSGGGIFLLLVFLSGTAIRTYTVYALHELMSDLRKPRAMSEASVGSTVEKEIKPEPRTVVEAEEGCPETTQPDEQTEAEAAPNDPMNTDASEEDNANSSAKSLQPTQGSLPA